MASRHGADHVALKLNRAGLTAAALHGELSQGARTRALADFKARRVRVLVATDVAARGLDIVQLPAVVNYDLPRSPVGYCAASATAHCACNASQPARHLPGRGVWTPADGPHSLPT